MGNKQPEQLELTDFWFASESKYSIVRKKLDQYWDYEIEAILDNNLMDLLWKELENDAK